jgi:hypothetical protein
MEISLFGKKDIASFLVIKKESGFATPSSHKRIVDGASKDL